MEALTAADLSALSRLREGFLSGANTGGGYWQSERDLSLYDSTFAERIGWKWDAVLAELSARSWLPSSRHVVDFGCGSGVAGRRVVDWLTGAGGESLASVTLADVSPLAMRYAERKMREQRPALEIRTGLPDGLEPGSLLLVSHVINELPPPARSQLMRLARQAKEIIWVEAGTHADSRALCAVREELRGAFAPIAPCTHALGCGILAQGNERHWCHHFARVPSEVFQDAAWAHFSREIGIDLRTLPYSFLVMAQNAAPLPPHSVRIIGEPRENKGRMQILHCAETGVTDATLQKRDAPELFKALHKGRAPGVQRWKLDGARIVSTE